MGSEDNNKAFARRLFEEAFSKGNFAVVDEVVAPNYTGSDPTVPGGIHGPAGLKQFMSSYRSAFPDLQFTINEILATGDTVVARWTGTGTHLGLFNGIPPTGNKGSVTGISVMHFANGKLAEDFVNWDTIGLMRQLGLIPDATPATATQSAQAQSPH